MNPDYLPALVQSLRTLGDFAARHDVTDATLAEIAAELDGARSLVASARGSQQENRCVRHPGGPFDPAADHGCLLCGRRQPQAQPPGDEAPVEDVARDVAELGEEEATRRHGPRAVAKALAAAGRGSHKSPPNTRRPYDEELP